MKYLAIIFSIVIGLSVSEVSAQDYLFRVLANKGTNQVKKAGSSAVNQLKTGSKLYSGDQIIASTGAYIGLVYKTGKTIEIKTSGIYKLEDLEGKMNKGTTSLTGRYMNFVMNKINASDEDVNRNYRRNLNATGAVSRAPAFGLSLLMKDAKIPNYVFGEKAILRWEGGEENDTYIVTVKDMFSEVLYEVESNKRKIELDFTSEELKPEQFYIVGVRSATSENMKSQEYGIQRLNTSEAIQANLKELEQQMTEGSSLNNLIYASFYEDKNLYLDALTEYEAVVNENPDIDDFKVLYEQFLETNGLGSD